MPVYVFRCDACDLEHELLRKLGDLAPPACPVCAGPTQQRLARVAVRYDGWGFTRTDSLVSSTEGKDFRTLRDKAEEIADS